MPVGGPCCRARESRAHPVVSGSCASEYGGDPAGGCLSCRRIRANDFVIGGCERSRNRPGRRSSQTARSVRFWNGGRVTVSGGSQSGHRDVQGERQAQWAAETQRAGEITGEVTEVHGAVVGDGRQVL